MRQNKLKQLLKSNNTVACGWLHIPNSWSAEVMANAGWDCVTVDMQHGLQSIETAIQMMQGSLQQKQFLLRDQVGILLEKS